MKTNKSLFYTITVCALMLSSTIAVAQTALRSAYYSENYLYRHQLNPALESNRDYFSFILGGINIQSNSDIPLNKLFYPRNGELVTFMHPTIGKEFLDDLSDNNRSGADINMTLASVGFHAFKGFNTVEMNIRASAYTNTPKGLYEFMKLGTAKEHYEFDHLGTNSESFIEVALGHQHNINQNLSVGGKIKFLLGFLHVDAEANDLSIDVNENKWSITGEGEMNFAALGIQIPTKTTETGGQTREVYDFRNISSSSIKPGLNGFGLAFDLGVLYKAPFAEGLEFSASVLDLGFASWSDANIGKMVGVWNFEGFKLGKGQKEFKDQWEQLGEELEDCFMFEPTGKTTKTNALSATMNLGVAYALPCYKRLKFGFLSSTRFNGPYTTSEGRFSANINPYGGLDIGVNYAITSFGSSFGWIVNVAQKGFNFYIGMDHTLGKVSKQFAPISGRSSLSLGISFPITSRKI